MTVSIAAHIFAFLIFIVIGFQIALVAGMPWGELTLGGKFPGVLPYNKRWIPLISVVLLVLFVLIVEIRAGSILSAWKEFSNSAIWFVVGYCALGVLANAITPSKWERIIWLPIVFIALICSVMVAIS